MAAYSQYWRWYMSPTVIRFERELGMSRAVPLGSAANVRELLEMLDVIESDPIRSSAELMGARFAVS